MTTTHFKIAKMFLDSFGKLESQLQLEDVPDEFIKSFATPRQSETFHRQSLIAFRFFKFSTIHDFKFPLRLSIYLQYLETFDISTNLIENQIVKLFRVPLKISINSLKPNWAAAQSTTRKFEYPKRSIAAASISMFE